MDRRTAEENRVAVGLRMRHASAATEPPAPGLFSTMTVPSVRLTLSAHGRPMMSNAPPGGNGKTSLIGRVGKLSALARRGAAENAVTPATSCRNRRRGNTMMFLFRLIAGFTV